MPLLADVVHKCETAPSVVEAIFVDTAIAVYDVHHRHLMKCWLNKHFVSGHCGVCLPQFEATLVSYIDDCTGSSASDHKFDAKWHLRFVNGFQLVSECDAPIRCLLNSPTCIQRTVDYFAFAIDKYIAVTNTSNNDNNNGLVYLEAKLLLKLVQIFSRIFGKISPEKNRSTRVPRRLIDALWTLAACDMYELDVRQASTNLIVQLDPAPSYLSFTTHAAALIDKMVLEERQPATRQCLEILGVGAFCSQLTPAQLVVDEENDGRVLLFILLEDIASCCSSRMSTSFAIAFYRSLHSWTKSAVATCMLKNPSIWEGSNVSSVFQLFVQLIDSGWDSHAEVVRDLVSAVFESLLDLFRHTSNRQDTFLEDLVCTLLRTDWQSRLKYRPLSQITELFGPDIMFQSAEKVGADVAEKISTAFTDRAIAPHAATFIASIVKSAACHSKSSFDEGVFVHSLVRHVVEAARRDEAVTRHFVTFAVPKLLKARGRRFVDIIVHRGTADDHETPLTDAEYLILFSVCRSARASGLYELSAGDELESARMARLLNEALNHSNIHIRLEGFGFLCENARVGHPLLAWELDSIERFIAVSFKIDSSDFRQTYRSLFRKLVHRLRDGGNAAERQGSSSSLIRDYTSFLDRVIGLCFESISFNGAAFARRATALNLLTFIVKTFPVNENWFNFSKYFFETRPGVKILIRALMKDTYEDNKKLAYDLIILNWQKSEENGWIDRSEVVEEATRLSQSTHPQDGMTAAYLFKLLASRYSENGVEMVNFLKETLLQSLKEQIDVAKGDLAKAAVSRPMYPTIICMRYVISEFRSILTKSPKDFREFVLELIEALRAVSNIVSPVITHQSPEGLQLDDSENEDENDENGDPLGLLPEFLTVCCWRSIKEVSLTLSLLVEISIEQCDSSSNLKLLQLDEIKSVGSYFSEMLLKARHRGAFEIAYAGFDHICAKLWLSQSQALNVLPAFWLKPLLSCFESTGDNVSLTATRRSAGLPFYFQAVVGNEPRLTHSVSVSLLETVLNLLIQRSLQTSTHNEIVCVHALNILRALVRDCRLEQAVAPFVGEAFIASMTALSSKNWSMRNSGTLLFSALMSRVFGVHREKFTPAKKNSMTGRRFFALYPNLFEFLLNFFSDNETEATSSVAVTFLSLFEHLYPSPFDVNESSSLTSTSGDESDLMAKNAPQVNVFAFIPALISLLGHRSIRVRVMSSRSIRNFVTIDSLPILLETLINRFNEVVSRVWDSNFIDGTLTLLRKLVVMFASDADSFQLVHDVSMSIVDFIRGNNSKNCFVTASLVHLLLKMIELKPPKFEESARLVQSGLEISNEIIAISKKPSTLLIRAVQCSILSICLKSAPVSLIEAYLVHPNKFVRLTTVDCLNDIFLRQFLTEEGSDGGLIASLFDDSHAKDEEYVEVAYPKVDLPIDHLLKITWKQLKSMNQITEHEFETSKLLTLFAFCVLLEPSSLDDETAQQAFLKLTQIMKDQGHLSELALPCNRALSAIAPKLDRTAQNQLVDILSTLVSGSDDYSKFRIAIFGLSRLSNDCVLLNDLACDVMLTLMTSSEPDIRELASWYITRKLCQNIEFCCSSSLHSGQALVIFISLVAKTRDFTSAIEWLLNVATTPKRVLTTDSANNPHQVFEAEETNPYAEDRLLSNICVLVLSIIINGREMTFKQLFPRLRLPVPIQNFFKHLSSESETNPNILRQIEKFQLVGAKSNPINDRTEIAKSIFESIPIKESDEGFFDILRRHLPNQTAMPRNEFIYQRLLICKILQQSSAIPSSFSEDIGGKRKFLQSDVFLMGDTAELDALLIC